MDLQKAIVEANKKAGETKKELQGWNILRARIYPSDV